MKIGTQILLTEGEYSAYTVIGIFAALREFTLRQALKDFRQEFAAGNIPTDNWDDEDDPRPKHFAAWLTREGFVEEQMIPEANLGGWNLNTNEWSDELLDL